MFCGNCGKPIAYANAKFCPACGAPVRVQPDAANEPPKVPVPPKPEETPAPQPAPQPAAPVAEPTPASPAVEPAPAAPFTPQATPDPIDDDATRIVTPAQEPDEDEGATRIFGFDEPAAPIAEQPAAAPQPKSEPEPPAAPAPDATAPLFGSVAEPSAPVAEPTPAVGPNSNSAPIPPQQPTPAAPFAPQAAPTPQPAQSPFRQPTQPITPNPAWQASPEPEVFASAKKEKKPGNGLLIFVIVLAVLVLAGGGLYFANDYFMLGLEKIPQKLGFVEEIVPDETTGETALPAAEAPAGESTADTPAAEPTAQPAQTPAPAATAAPTAAPQAVAATADSVVLHGVPDGATITINGQNAAATVQNGDAALSKTALGDAAQLRVIVNQDGNWRAAAVWYTADQGSEITLSDSDFKYSGSEDGYMDPDDAYLENVALNYYKAFLNAVNDHDLSEMRFSTARNTDEQSSHVFSDLNAGNTYDTSTASCTLDGSSLTWGTYSLTVNVSYMCVREDRDTGVREINSNHRTIYMVWQDGMWQVDDIAFLSDDDFAAHKYADLNK